MNSHLPYNGLQASLATQHGKLELIAPALAEKLSLTVVNVPVDTDVLGTFSGDIPRRGTPFETAVAKARLGMESSGLALGIANEGTIGPHPSVPFVVADTELVVFVDSERSIVVAESETDFGIPSFSADIHPSECSKLSLEAAGFPDHGLMVLPVGAKSPIFKGIHSRDELEDAVWRCHRESGESLVSIQSDFRANHHPSRRKVIERAAHRLAARLAVVCPRCATPGWGIARHEAGAPCSFCRTKTSQVRSVISSCVSCSYEESHDIATSAGVDPMHCPRCNP